MRVTYISVIIPAFNEAARIIPTLEEVVDHLNNKPYKWEVIIVDDGSTDATARKVTDWSRIHSNVQLIKVKHRGKGWAVRTGMLTVTGIYRFMCDADLAMPIRLLDNFLLRMEDGYEIVIGSREIAGGVRYNEPVLRHLIGRVFNWTIKLLAVNRFQDTQCGFKCFTQKAADQLFSRQRNTGWGFDAEILFLANQQGLNILELPVEWYYQPDSKIRVGIDSLLMFKETLSIRWNYYRYFKHFVFLL